VVNYLFLALAILRNFAVLQEYSMWLCEELGMEKNSRELHVVTPLHLRKFEVLSRQERYNHNADCIIVCNVLYISVPYL